MTSTPFNAATFFASWSDDLHVPSSTSALTFQQCITRAFNLPENDTYVYRAQGETTLAITQKAINGKRAHGLHDWYHDEEGKVLNPAHPSTEETGSYTSLFSPSLSLPKALTAFHASAKPSTLRHAISQHLKSRFLYNPPPNSQPLLPPKKPRKHKNPYYSLWTYASHELEYAGPLPSTTFTRTSHHILPIFYHHFGCIVPSYAALYVLARLAQPSKPSREPVKPILDIGSGNGYWTCMLRRFIVAEEIGREWKEMEVYAVDNQVSEYRTTWIPDTIVSDGVDFLTNGTLRDGTKVDGGRGCILLLVYPQATGDFTSKVMKAFRGDTIVVAGTQNGNGFTGFRDVGVDEWVERNLNGEFELVLRMPLPSFAGKDEALFVWQRRKV